MEGLLKYNYAAADATGVAHDNIDAELAQNRQEKLEKIIHQSKEEGSIRALPYLQTAEGQQTMLDMAMNSAFPGSALGRVSKAAATGGELSKAGSAGKAFYHRLLKDMDAKEFLGRADWDKKVDGTRKLMEKAYDKFGIRHNENLNDPITETLRALGHRKN